MQLKDKNSSGGYSLFTIIQINFLILKLTSLINWDWIWVLSPSWIPLIPFLAALIFKKISK